MIRIFLCLFIFIVHYLEYVWKYFQKPIIFLIIRQCKNEKSSLLISYIQPFLWKQYEKILGLFSNISSIKRKEEECDLYKINLHLPIIFFILKCLCIFYCFILILKFFIWFYEKECYFILQKQVKPFVHIRSVALTNKTKY